MKSSDAIGLGILIDTIHISINLKHNTCLKMVTKVYKEIK